MRELPAQSELRPAQMFYTKTNEVGRQCANTPTLTPEASPMQPHSTHSLDRFWSKVSIAGRDDCWPWIAAKGPDGYGRYFTGKTADGRSVITLAPRVAYQLANGSIPDGMHILHSCDNPPCCNPMHLRAGTAKENAREREERGRGNHAVGERNGMRLHPERRARGDRHGWHTQPNSHPRLSGERNPAARLTTDQVDAIRRMRSQGALLAEISAQFGISQSQVSRIVRGENWSSDA